MRAQRRKLTKVAKFREDLEVGMDTVLTPKKPPINIIDENILEVLSHAEIFSRDACVSILEESPSEWEVSTVNATHNSDAPLVRENYRNSLHHWIEPSTSNMELYDTLLAITLAANKRFKFEIDMFEAVQLARYEVGMHYNWHLDIGPGHMGNRKLSITVQLSDPDSYEGGDLVLENGSAAEDVVASRELGSVTVFPSFMKHKVTPVTKGVRHSLVAWVSGVNRFR